MSATTFRTSHLNETDPGATILAARTLGDIAASVPGATSVFRRHKLDFCCGGRVSLEEAAAAKGLDLAGLESELACLLPATRASAPQATDELIDLIEQRYHAAHRRELPELVRLAKRVEAVHRAHPSVPAGLADLLDRIGAELESHMTKEEQVLFPLMRRGAHPAIVQPIIAAMLAEHDDHGALLRELEAITQDFTAPDDACATWRALYLGSRKFAGDLVEHVHTENNVLFPRFGG